MEKYGKIFDSTFNLGKDRVYYLINEYYDNPNVKKIKDTIVTLLIDNSGVCT